jgi:transforming growth factor-beta-induced protein
MSNALASRRGSIGKRLLILFFSLAALTSIKAQSTNTIVDVAAGNPNFSILVQAVTKAQLVDALKADGPFTVFAPTNAAFEALFAQLGVKGIADLTKEQLTPILLYHVLGQKVPSSALKAGQTVATLQEGLLTVLKQGDKVTVNGINVVLADVEASNGVIHAIERVLLPNDLVAVASGNPTFSILVEAVAKAELVDALRAKGPFTVFAPTNAAFQALFAQLGVGGVADLTKEQLTPVLLYHVLSGAVLSTDVSDGLMAPTLLEGNRVRVSITGNAVKIDESNLILTDVAATNGVIHVLDQVLLPTGKVTKLTLVNAQTGADIQTIEAGATIDLGSLSAEQVSVRADVFPQAVGSVTIALDGNARTENYLPYSLLGDSYLQTPVTYTPWEPASGTFTITATPYSRFAGAGTAGVPLSVTFSVTGGASNGMRLSVYPNPSDRVANIRFAGGGNEEVEISVYDNYGKLYLRERRQLTAGESALDLSGLPRGTYQVHTLRGSKAAYARITKQ